MVNRIQFTQLFIPNNSNFKKMNREKILVHVNGGLGTLICRNKFKKFNYTKINKSTVLRPEHNLKLTCAFTDFSIIEIFLIIPRLKSSETSVTIFSFPKI